MVVLGQDANAIETEQVIEDFALIEESTALPMADPFTNFSATFSAYRYGRELGHATLALSKLADNHYRLDYSSNVSIFFLSDKRKETSLFSIQDNQIIPDNYVFKRTGTGSDKHVRVDFDHEKGKILVNDRPSFPLQQQLDNQLYRLDLQAKLAKGETDFSYEVINYRGELKQYQLSVLTTESLSLPYGTLDAIKVGFVRENSSRQTYAWFSPKLNYQLVRLQQFKDGDEQGDIQLSQYTTDD
ncbi:DUF3108 domain-containing protein [Paraglaciecola sp.]|uniref:DUF3108 domain-containing protein n=1 Tax=Paraglaciecola sp. TaxID=1920173 RepID=UPI0030F47F92